ncbi:MAG TPA: hypothetical protein VD929_04340 [Caulobacteraceae bacterium]|nr:hypothetical protein [Caulobacteraceae bacterium]
MYLFIHPDGSVKAVAKREDLKGHYKFAGYEGKAVELSGTPFALDEFKPKAPASAQPAAAPVSGDVQALIAQNKALSAQLESVLEALKAKPADPKPSA